MSVTERAQAAASISHIDLDAAPMGGWVFKGTQNSDLFVHRWVEIYRQGVLRTYHDFEADKKNCKSWYFDRKCELEPKTADEIVTSESKLVRGRGTWTITATVRGQGQPVKLFLFTIVWPSRWAPKGYSSLTIGSEDVETARAWHGLAEQSIMYVRNKYLLQERKVTRSVPSMSPTGTWSAAVALTNRTAAEIAEEGSIQEQNAREPAPHSSPMPVLRIVSGRKSTAATMGGTSNEAMTSDGGVAADGKSRLARALSVGGTNAAGKGDIGLYMSSSETQFPASTPTASTPTGTANTSLPMPVRSSPPGSPQHARVQPGQNDRPVRVPGGGAAARRASQLNPTILSQALDPAGSSDDDGPSAGGVTRPKAGRKHWWGDVSERWVPYKQTNGVAIYHLDEPNANCSNRALGGEYMVSAGVRGCPADVLDVLMNGSSHTTILGPASTVELLECSERDNSTREVFRLVLEAPGWAGWMCAPREMLVERMLKTEEGMHVVLFSSVEPTSVEGLRQLSPRAQAQQSKSRSRQLRSMYSTPVRGEVRGTYAIAPLEGHRLETSPETLITCIIKVDLRGVCGDQSWLRPFADGLGWTDAFLDRILMSVILVRDQVEHSRFVLKPLTLLARSTGPPVSRHASRAKVADASSSAMRLEGGDLGAINNSFSSAASGMPTHASNANMAGPHGHGMGGSSSGGSEPGSPRQMGGIGRRSMGIMHSRLNASDHHAVDGGLYGAGKSSNQMGKQISKQMSKKALDDDPYLSATGNAFVEPLGHNPMWDEPAVSLDLAAIRQLATLSQTMWEDIHAPGKDAPFVVRGPTYLKDRKKIPAGLTAFTLAAMDVVTMPHPVEHVARYLPCVRQGRAPFAFVVNLIIPGTPLLGIVATFITDRHPDILGTPPQDPMDEDHVHGWDAFDFVLHKFLHGDNATRNLMLKLIPHIADGSWVIKQSVGTTPVITGKALKTTYHVTKSYIEVSIDVSANNVAAYVTGLVRGATKNLVIDMGFVLEGTKPWELPECLLGTLRLNYLDLKYAVPLDLSRELPLKPAVAMPEGTLHKRTRSAASGGMPKI